MERTSRLESPLDQGRAIGDFDGIVGVVGEISTRAVLGRGLHELAFELAERIGTGFGGSRSKSIGVRNYEDCSYDSRDQDERK